jgi:tetratricopeptide (TPR) repeat protein
MVKTLCFALALVTGWAFGWAGLPTAAAQGSAESQREAKRLFEQGLAFGKSQRWEEALSSFQASAELVPRASTSYNIANALYRLDQPMDGLKELERYEALSEVRYNYAAQQRGEALRVLLEESVAQVQLEITPLGAQLFVDGQLFSAVGLERTLRLNPGKHSLWLTHDNYASLLVELDLERGALEKRRIALEPLTAPPPPAAGLAATGISATTTGAPQDDRERFVKRPGFWVMIGAIALVGVGVGVTVAMVRRDDTPQCGTTGDCATTAGLTLTSF